MLISFKNALLIFLFYHACYFFIRDCNTLGGNLIPYCSPMLATVFFKKHNSLKKSRVGCNWCVLCRRIKRESILSLCEPRTLFKGINQNPIQKMG